MGRALWDKEVNQAPRDSDDALVCYVENMVEDRIIDSGASFHGTYCKEELERCIVPRLGTNVEAYIWLRYTPRGLEQLLMVVVVQLCNTRDLRRQRNCKSWSKFIQKAITLHLLHQSEDLATMILLSKTAGGVANGIVILKMVPKIPLQFGVAERASPTFRAKSTGVVYSRGGTVREGYKSRTLEAFEIRRVIKLFEAEISHLWTRFMDPKNDSIVAEHGLSSRNTQSPGESSDTSEGFKNSGSFEDSERSDKEDSEDGAFSEEGVSETPQLRRSTRDFRAPVKYSPSANYLLLTKNGEPETYSEALSSKEFIQ
nr:putative retrovirus-related Pol polyprotein from transposon TNT 1-94 [Tanacetum cinerariifolium]